MSNLSAAYHRAVRPLLIAGLLLLLTANSLAAANLSEENLLAKRYRLAKASLHNLTVDTKNAATPAAWQNVVKRFTAIYHADREKKLAPGCLFLLGLTHEEKARRTDNPVDLGMAITYYRDLADTFPRHSLADDALLAMGRIYQEAKQDNATAARTYARLVALYPHGDQSREAAERLLDLKGAALASADAPPLPVAPAQTATATALPTESAAGATPATPPSEPAPSLAGMATLQPLKHWSNNDYTRIVIETSKEVAYTKSLLPRNDDLPRRLYVDLDNCRLTPDLAPSMPIGDGLLKQVRSAQFAPSTVRVVLDIESISDHKIFSLHDPFRVVIDVKGDRPKEEKIQEITKTGKQKPGPPPSLAQQLGLGIRKVVIDPGHGGKDPGAVSPSGIKEKDVTLAVATQVAAILHRDLHCQVIMTRSRDVFVPLEERTAIANTSKGDLFLSIHVNAAPQPEVKGIETYFLDLARTNDAMEVAARENATSTGQMSNLQAILMDLIQSTKINESAKLAECVQENMVNGLSRRYSGIGNLGVKRAPFVVLIGAQMPSVLTEIAFLSNPEDAKRLKNPKFITAVAEEIVTGVSIYAQQLNVASLQFR